MIQTAKKIIPEFIKRIYREIKLKQIEKKYAGIKVECPICHSTYSAFGDFGLPKRKNARCHRCGSLERHRLIWKYLFEHLNITDKKLSILHFAPEKMFYDIFSASHNFNYHPCDLYPEHYPHFRNTTITKADITAIPFKANYFDFILCNHVLEHIPNDKQAMAELYRVMKPSGFGIFQVPIDYSREQTYEDFSITSPQERAIAFGQHDHVRWYGKDYKKRLGSVGFQVTVDNYVATFSESEHFKYGLMVSELIYYCKKPATTK